MIVTTQKPLDEMLDYISPYGRILIAGCDGCTQPPRGLREAKTLSQLLELGGKLRSKDFVFKVNTLVKQCDSYLVASTLRSQVEGVEAVLSLACGIGVQTLAGIFPELPILPSQNTHFMGAEDREAGTLEEKCAGCGDCMLAMTGGVCPVARCSKGLLNGACGGNKNGKCELDPERDCAWILLYEQLEKRGKLEALKEFRLPMDYQLSGWRVKP
ncbi:methylenetetrahydrofolate reductase C-terminal domain-containing protein [Chloroflexota bacterium]